MSLKSKLDQVKALGVANSAMILKNKLFRKFTETKQRNIDNSNVSYRTYNSVIDFNYRVLPAHTKIQLELEKNIILENADFYINHQFDLLGSGLTKVHHGAKTDGFENSVYQQKLDIHINNFSKILINDSNSEFSNNTLKLIKGKYTLIDWQLDFRSGFRWSEKTWFKDIRYGYDAGADIKVPWELGRMQHLIIIANAYAIYINAGEIGLATQILDEYRNQIIDFIASNPPRFGCQWTTSMDVSIRLVSILTSMDIFTANGAEFDYSFSELLRNSLIEHIMHIQSNLEISGNMRGNHYLANIAGLCFALAYLKDSQLKTDLNAFCVGELSKEILFQFNPDGSNFEASAKYHLFATEMVLYSLFALSHTRGAIPTLFANKAIETRLQAIINFTESIICGDYSSSIGDVDSGYFLRFTPCFISKSAAGTTFSYIDTENTESITALINGIRNSQTENNYYEERIGHFIGEFLKFVKSSNSSKLIYKDFGLELVSNNSLEVMLFAGSIGQNGKGGHSHNDKLSFEIFCAELPFLVDPGTYCYTSNWGGRNRFRSVNYHNTLVFDGIEQNKFNKLTKDDLFWIAENNTKCAFIQSDERTIKAQCEYSGVIHNREITMSEHEIVGKDSCNSEKAKEYHFHFAPDIRVEQTESGLMLTSAGKVCIFTSDCQSIDICDYYYSPHYGIKEKSKKIIAKTSNNVHNWKFSFILE